MKKTYFALITFTLAFATQAAPSEIPEKFIGNYVQEGEKCDRTTDGKFKTKNWMNVSKKIVEAHYFDDFDELSSSSVCRSIKVVKVKGDLVTFKDNCGEGGSMSLHNLKKNENGITFVYGTFENGAHYQFISCQSK